MAIAGFRLRDGVAAFTHADPVEGRLERRGVGPAHGEEVALLAGGGHRVRCAHRDAGDGLVQLPALERRAAEIEERALVRGGARGAHRPLGRRAVVERQGDGELARGEAPRPQRAA